MWGGGRYRRLRRSQRKSAPRWQETAALRDFDPAFVRFGSAADNTRHLPESALPPKADIERHDGHVPKADIRIATDLFDHLVGAGEQRRRHLQGR
jgi:hypothetical protein